MSEHSEELLSIAEVARRLHLPVDELRRRLDANESIVIAGRRLSLRQASIVRRSAAVATVGAQPIFLARRRRAGIHPT